MLIKLNCATLQELRIFPKNLWHIYDDVVINNIILYVNISIYDVVILFSFYHIA